MRGSAALVTFVYTHCHDVCPLIVAELAAAERELGSWRGRVQIIAATVDPHGDTPEAVKNFLAARGALGRMYYLIGPRARMLPVWRAWDVGVSIAGKQVTVGHTAVVYGITASGRIAVLYPSGFSPEAIVHDAQRLARM